jgi:hypothetical protein
MQKVERFVTKDGHEFKTIDDAQKYEQIIMRGENIMAPLGKETKLSAGPGRFKQHAKEAFFEARKGIVTFAAEIHKKPEWKRDAEKIHQHSILGQYLIDLNSPLLGLWARLMCFDDQGREFLTEYDAVVSVRKGNGGAL